MNPEPARSLFEVSSIMRHDCLYMPIYRCVENQFVICVHELWPPDEVDLNRDDNPGKLDQEPVNLAHWKSVLGAFEDLFVFEKECGAGSR